MFTIDALLNLACAFTVAINYYKYSMLMIATTIAATSGVYVMVKENLPAALLVVLVELAREDQLLPAGWGKLAQRMSLEVVE